jgi:hypothetical protein
MTAEEAIKLIQTMEPGETERLFVMIKEYEAEVRHRQRATKRGRDPVEFQRAVDRVFEENRELFSKLAELEWKEKETKP